MINLIKRNSFFKAINEASGEERTQMMAEIEEYRNKQLAQARIEADKKYVSLLNAAKTRLDSEDGIRAQERIYKLKKEVAQMSENIINNVFERVTQMLTDFTKTEGYTSFVISSAKQMLQKCGEYPIEIYLKPDDYYLSQTLEAISKTICVKTDDTIKIGGIYGVCKSKGIRLNDLLESRLNENRSWFYENSGIGGV